MPSQDTQSEKHVWELKARPLDNQVAPWETVHVSAKSVLQAEAIMRRKGYEISRESARVCDDQPSLNDHARLRPLACSQCGYELAGLTLDRASVLCPECNTNQPLMIWTTDVNKPPARFVKSLNNVLVLLGILFLLLIFLVMFPIMFF